MISEVFLINIPINKISFIFVDRKPFGSGVLRRVKKAGTDLMNKVPTKSVSFQSPLQSVTFDNNTDLYRIDDHGSMNHA